MPLTTKPYSAQGDDWPRSGRHILAHYDESSVVAYQAHEPDTAAYAVENGHFLGAPGYEPGEVVWFRPRVLGALWASGWDSVLGDARLLAIYLDRVGFDAILRKAVLNSYHPLRFKSRTTWRRTLAASWVRVDWEPDRDLAGRRLRRHVITVGLRGKSMRYFANGGWILKIEDVTTILDEVRQVIRIGEPSADLHLPLERRYPVYSAENARWLGITAPQVGPGQKPG